MFLIKNKARTKVLLWPYYLLKEEIEILTYAAETFLFGASDKAFFTSSNSLTS